MGFGWTSGAVFVVTVLLRGSFSVSWVILLRLTSRVRFIGVVLRSGFSIVWSRGLFGFSSWLMLTSCEVWAGCEV